MENSPEKGHKKDREVGSCDIRGEAETAVISYSSEQKNWVNPTLVYELLLGRNKEDGAKIFSEVPNERTSENGSKGDFGLWVFVCFAVTVAQH